MRKRGLFITMEGGEGVGKSTNLAFLENYFSNNGIEIVVTREPGGTQLGEEIRELLLEIRREPVSPITELLLLFAARAQHIRELIEPALVAGKWVLCDRFTDATYAYQCAGRGVDRNTVRKLEELVQGDLRPDYTILLDVPVAIGMNRARSRADLDRIERETMDFFERVRSSYLDQAKNNSERYLLIDAGRSLEEVQKELIRFGRKLLACRSNERPDA